MDGQEISPRRAFWLNMIPVPIGLGWLYLGLSGQATVSMIVRIAGYSANVLGLIGVGLTKCPNETCDATLEFLGLVVGINMTIALVSAIHAHEVATSMKRKTGTD